MKLVLDTNVWLDCLIFADPRVDALRTALAQGSLTVLATQSMLDEFADVIGRPQFGIDPQARARLAARQLEQVSLCGTAPDCRLNCTDRADQMFIDLAVAQRVEWLVSRDKALLRLRKTAARRFSIRIGTPEEWITAAQSELNHPPIIDDRFEANP